MDAKPQRPRTLRIHNDENAYPALPQGKTLHQRTKSTPAFGALLQAGAIKTAGMGKRVLGEGNANSKISQPAKDDSVIVKKAFPEKGVVVEPTKPAATYARPVTRTASKSLSGTLASAYTSSNAQAPVRQPVDSHAPSVDAVRKVVKKSSKVLKDPIIRVDNKPHTFDLPVVSEDVSLPEPESKREVQPKKVQAEVSKSLSVHDKSTRSEGVQLPQRLATKTDAEPLIEEVVHTDIEETSDPTLQFPMPGSFASESNNATTISAPTNQTDPMQLTHVSEAVAVKMPQQPAATLPYDPSYTQYIDEHDQYYYEAEEGYTTTKSFGVPAENTGAITTVIQPKSTDKDKAEIEAAKLFVEATRPAEDVDDELWDISMVAEYSDDIFEYMHELEDRMSPNPRYMDDQQEIQWSMRAVLVDWLVQVHQRFNLLPETLFLTVNYIDRFLSCKIVSLQKLQLVGATAIFVASKYEEVNCPTVSEIVYMVDGGYSEQDIMKAERFMLSMLQFELGWPGPMSFLRRISKADDYDLETRTLAKYFLEITLMDERFVGSKPSFLAAGAHCLARLMLQKGDWSTAHVYYSDYTFAQLRSLLEVMLECCENPKVHHLAVFEKYCDRRYKKAAMFVASQMSQGFRLPPVTTRPTSRGLAQIEASRFPGSNIKAETGVPVDPACC